MFGIGSAELLIILLVALLVLGPEKLPSLARTLGKAMGEFRRMSTDFQRTLNAEAALDEALRQKEPKVQDKTPPVREATGSDHGPDAKQDAAEPDARQDAGERGKEPVHPDHTDHA
jgi:sec-independent protein translocase protein TatB